MTFSILWTLALAGLSVFASETQLPTFDPMSCARRLDFPSSPDLNQADIGYDERAEKDLAWLGRTATALTEEIRRSTREPLRLNSSSLRSRYVLYPDGFDSKPLIRVEFSEPSRSGAIIVTAVEPVDLPHDRRRDEYVRLALVPTTTLALTASPNGLVAARAANLDFVHIEDALLNQIAPPVRADAARPTFIWTIGRSPARGLISLNCSCLDGVARIQECHCASEVDARIFRKRSGLAHGFQDIFDGKLQGIRLTHVAAGSRDLANLGIGPDALFEIARSAPGVIFAQEFGQFYGRVRRSYFEVNVVKSTDTSWSVVGIRAVSFEKFRRFDDLIRRQARGRSL